MARSLTGTDNIVTTMPTTSVGTITIAGWANVANATGYQAIFYNGTGASNGYGLFTSNNGNGIVAALFGGQQFWSSGISMPLAAYVHLVLVREGAAGSGATWYIYVNASKSGALGSVDPVTPTGNFYIGQDGSNNHLSGSVADVGYWNVALVQAEVTALYNGALPHQIRPASLIGNWPIDGQSSPEPDLSGNARNGTLTGTAFAPGPPVSMFTPRWPINYALPTVTSVFRRTRSRIGTRTGSRQAAA